jgi:hypothetical protein
MRANVDLREVDGALKDMYLRSKRMGPAFRELSPIFRRDQRDHAKNQEGPDGPWKERAPSTMHKRKLKKRKARVTKAMRMIMIQKPKRRRTTPSAILGRLPKLTRFERGPLWVRATSRLTWIGGANQHGARVGRRRRVVLPARPYLWLSKEVLNETRRILSTHIVRGWYKKHNLGGFTLT